MKCIRILKDLMKGATFIYIYIKVTPIYAQFPILLPAISPRNVYFNVLASGLPKAQ